MRDVDVETIEQQLKDIWGEGLSDPDEIKARTARYNVKAYPILISLSEETLLELQRRCMHGSTARYKLIEQVLADKTLLGQ